MIEKDGMMLYTQEEMNRFAMLSAIVGLRAGIDAYNDFDSMEESELIKCVTDIISAAEEIESTMPKAELSACLKHCGDFISDNYGDEEDTTEKTEEDDDKSYGSAMPWEDILKMNMSEIKYNQGISFWSSLFAEYVMADLCQRNVVLNESAMGECAKLCMRAAYRTYIDKHTVYDPERCFADLKKEIHVLLRVPITREELELRKKKTLEKRGWKILK